eukprot:10496319-Alexandrium_andersonii.AAC.1
MVSYMCGVKAAATGARSRECAAELYGSWTTIVRKSACCNAAAERRFGKEAQAEPPTCHGSTAHNMHLKASACHKCASGLASRAITAEGSPSSPWPRAGLRVAIW